MIINGMPSSHCLNSDYGNLLKKTPQKCLFSTYPLNNYRLGRVARGMSRDSHLRKGSVWKPAGRWDRGWLRCCCCCCIIRRFEVVLKKGVGGCSVQGGGSATLIHLPRPARQRSHKQPLTYAVIDDCEVE